MQDCIYTQCGFTFDRIYHCPHLPSQNCDCRKPKTGMIESACKDFNIDLTQSFFVGDNSLKNVQKITTLHQLHSIIKNITL